MFADPDRVRRVNTTAGSSEQKPLNVPPPVRPAGADQAGASSTNRGSSPVEARPSSNRPDAGETARLLPRRHQVAGQAISTPSGRCVDLRPSSRSSARPSRLPGRSRPSTTGWRPDLRTDHRRRFSPMRLLPVRPADAPVEDVQVTGTQGPVRHRPPRRSRDNLTLRVSASGTRQGIFPAAAVRQRPPRSPIRSRSRSAPVRLRQGPAWCRRPEPEHLQRFRRYVVPNCGTRG